MEYDLNMLAYAAAGLIFGALVLVYVALVLLSPAPIITHESEKSYRTYTSPKTPVPLPSLSGPSTVDLSIVIPAYNETERLPIMLDQAIEYLNSTSKSDSSIVGTKPTYEILIVDDGSTDKTTQVALKLAKKYATSDIRVVTLEKNLGKGGAVRHGMLHAGGERLLMVDADGASRFSDLALLEEEMDKVAPDAAPGVVVGSRAHLVKTAAVVKRSLLRNILMYGFHTALRIAGVGHIRDTQCGFKLFSRSAAQQIFPMQHLPTWIFDVELLLIAKHLRIPVGEVSIEWHEVPGSKLNVMTASLQMFKDLLVIRGNYLFGRWSEEKRLKRE